VWDGIVTAAEWLWENITFTLEYGLPGGGKVKISN
jgi:hypothetical protein